MDGGETDESLGEVEQQPQQDTAKDDIAELLKEVEELQQKAEEIRQIQARLFEEYVVGSSRDPTKAAVGDTQMENSKDMEEVEPLSIFVGNVCYGCTADEVQQHFQACGAMKRVTIMRDIDKNGQSKRGYAYVEFAHKEAVEEALQLNESQLHGRKLKVMRKRRIESGMKQQNRPRNFYSPYGHSPRSRRPSEGPDRTP